MNGKPKESDWKKFRNMLPELREKYLNKRNKKIGEILNDPKKIATECFWNTEKRIKKEAHILRECLDDYSRSSMDMKLISMCRYGMLEKQDIEKFSEELQAQYKEVWERRNT